MVKNPSMSNEWIKLTDQKTTRTSWKRKSAGLLVRNSGNSIEQLGRGKVGKMKRHVGSKSQACLMDRANKQETI